LNELNHLFYGTVAESFCNTRQNAWEGWQALLPYIKKQEARPALGVLDLGCGNGRFGLFLAEHFGTRLHYVGLDFAPDLLTYAAESLGRAGVPAHLYQGDLVAAPWPPWTADFDLVCLFGVLHHIPSFERRAALIRQACAYARGGGLVALTFWAFYEQARFRQRIVPWDAPHVPAAYQGLALEVGDYLLDWRGGEKPALRYCHYVSPQEQADLLDGLTVLAAYEADTANRYVLLTLA
jgi:SAM-dependent methyltransferase